MKTKHKNITHKKTIGIVIIVIVAVALLSVIMINPVIQGYSTYQDFQEQGLTPENAIHTLEVLEENLTIAQATLESCKENAKNTLSLLGDKTAQHEGCQNALGSAQTSIDFEKQICSSKKNQLEDLVNDCTTASKIIEEELSNSQKAYRLLVRNAGHNKCCKERFDTPGVIGFEVTNDGHIRCTEKGGELLDCDIPEILSIGILSR